MKKVGIVTFHRPYNYGANLQAYALQKKLQTMGYDVKIIDYRNKNIEETTKVVKTNFKGMNLKQIVKTCIANVCFLNKNILRKREFKKFQEQNYELSNIYKSKNELEDGKEVFDIYISGSDQIWNPEITKGIDDVYTLNLDIKNIKRISYASSLGNVKLDSYKKELISRLKKYDFLSVREKAAQELLKEEINKKIEVVLDPTLLLSQKQWNSIIKNENKETEEYILFYTISEDKNMFKIVNKLSEMTNLKIITFRRSNGNLKNVLKNYYTKGPEDFINAFKNAKYIVTSSFHGTVFSIIYNKPFFVNYCGTENKRVDNLLNVLNIKDRYINKPEDLTIEKINQKVDYQEINQNLSKEAARCEQYLKNTIEEE